MLKTKTALYTACEQGNESIVEVLLSSPEVDVNLTQRVFILFYFILFIFYLFLFIFIYF